MEPELLTTARAVLEPTSEGDPEEVGAEEKDVVEEELEEAEDDRVTAVQIAQFLRVNKYRYVCVNCYICPFTAQICLLFFCCSTQ